MERIRLFCFTLITASLFLACNSNNNSGNASNNKKIDQQNKEHMMPDTTSNLLEYDSTKTKTGR